MGQMHDRSDVHLHHIEQPLRLDLAKLAISAETGIVDQHFNGQALLLGKTKISLGASGRVRSAAKTCV